MVLVFYFIVRKGNDAKNLAIVGFFFVTKSTQSMQRMRSKPTFFPEY